jgi:hypothetical protein
LRHHLHLPRIQATAKGEQAGTYLTKESNANKALAGLRAFCEDVKLLCQLFTLGTVLLRFTSLARHELGGHSRDSYGSEDTAERGDELRFNYFNSDVVDKAFQSNL